MSIVFCVAVLFCRRQKNPNIYIYIYIYIYIVNKESKMVFCPTSPYQLGHSHSLQVLLAVLNCKQLSPCMAKKAEYNPCACRQQSSNQGQPC